MTFLVRLTKSNFSRDVCDIFPLLPYRGKVVADTVDGKKLTGYVPYYFVVKTLQGGESTLRDVKQITVKASLD
jgi:hypothetical protein